MIDSSNIQSLVGNHVAPYIYNSKEFIPGKTPIYYSGPYWDNREIEAAINAFVNGKWITTGENVFKFERAFSRRFNVKHSLMVNSGSSANLVMITALKTRFNWQDEDFQLQFQFFTKIVSLQYSLILNGTLLILM